MLITFWGVRGSLASPMRTNEFKTKLRDILYSVQDHKLNNDAQINDFIEGLPEGLKNITGGNTTCVSVEDSDGGIHILDAGSGLRVLGDRMMKGPAGEGKAEFNIFITHTHWDHICGIPFFKPLYIPGNKVNFYSPIPDLHDRLRYQQDARFFPKEFDDLEADKIFHVMEAKQAFDVNPGLKVTPYPLRHPGGCFAYKFQKDNKVFIFSTDVEITGADLENVEEGNTFFDDCDALVIDAQYTLDESFQKFDWGHTSITMAVNCASRWRVKNLFLTHHEPAYSDQMLNQNLELANEHAEALMIENLNIFLAREGTKFRI